MDKPVRHQPFDSIYREKFEVVEERRDHQRLYPHTEQLPLLSRAINLDFYDALPGRIAATDHRGDRTRKLLLHMGAFWYCAYINLSRSDEVRLYPVYTPELVAQIGIIQQIVSSERLGSRYRFRLFTGTEFLPDIHLTGKRYSFAAHVFDRFRERVPLGFEAHPVDLLRVIWRTVGIVAGVGKSLALLFDHGGSFIALPFEIKDDEIFFTTCLTPREINELEFEDSPHYLRFHYGADFPKPAKTNYDPAPLLAHFRRCWDQRTPVAKAESLKLEQFSWHTIGNNLKRCAALEGLTPKSHFEFLDHVYGPAIVYLNRVPPPPAPPPTT